MDLKILIIVPTPKLDTIALNTHTTITVISYFNFPLVILEKYFPVAEVNPIAVVKQASETIAQRTILPGYPNNPFVITTIKDAFGVFTPYGFPGRLDSVAPKYVRPP